MFILDHTKKPETTDDVGLPGAPKLFVPKPGMSAKAIEEAALAAEKGL